MGPKDAKLEELYNTSKQVLLDCCLLNGAVVAANTDHSYYPKGANDYRYVWPRDAAFILYALDLIGESKTTAFAKWLLNRAEGFSENGLSYRRYATNGAASYAHNELQPDQSGALLWSLCSSTNVDNPDIQQTINIIGNTLISCWNGQTFTQEAFDLWEHHHGADSKGNFTYSIACCIHGLELASKKHSSPNPKWIKTAEEMRSKINVNSPIYFASTDEHSDQLDASLFGLGWPFKINSDEKRLRLTFDAIKDRLSNDTGIKRFSDDPYDGTVSNGNDQNKGAGSWPLLTLWSILAYQAIGETQDTLGQLDKLLNLLKDLYIPEQIFTDEREGVKPLGWAHALFVIVYNSLKTS